MLFSHRERTHSALNSYNSKNLQSQRKIKNNNPLYESKKINLVESETILSVEMENRKFKETIRHHELTIL